MNPSLGIALKIASVFFFAIMLTCVKAATAEIPPGEVAFFRSFFTLVPVMAWLAWRGEVAGVLVTRNFKGHLWRAGIGLIAMVLQFSAVALLPLPDVVAIGYAMPLFAILFAAVLLGEIVHGYRWAAVLIGLSGVLVILWPRLAFLKGVSSLPSETWGAACAVAGAMAIALATITIKKLVVGERTPTIVTYFSINCSAASLLTLPFGWLMPTPTTTLLLVICGIAGGMAQILLTESFRYADNSTLAIFDYTSLVFAVLIAWLLFAELPTPLTLLGAAIVIASGAYVAWREHCERGSTSYR
jgi:drug/metabolite transporter (DMT)-like permease